MVNLRGQLLWTSLGRVVAFAKVRAQRRDYDGTEDAALMAYCRHLYRVNPEVTAALIYTRDIGHHSGGWWKNPEYERCLHLSLSFRDFISNSALAFSKKDAFEIATAFFGEHVRKCWVEPPYTPEGKECDVHHYRLFCDACWAPIVPRFEVYDKRSTPPEWKSFSEIHGWSPAKEDAPWLKAASE